MNNPFDYTPAAECESAYNKLLQYIDELRDSLREEDIRFCRELDEGKMLGVLIGEADDGEHQALYAFSGQVGSGGFHFPGFVEPVFDYLRPEGYFKRKEAEIVSRNKEIEIFEKETLPHIVKEFREAQERLSRPVSEYKEKCKESKIRREERRKSEQLGESELAEMIHQSQFEKAELRRMKQRMVSELEPYSTRLESAKAQLEEMRACRRAGSESLQQWLFSNFRLLNARGETRTLSEIFSVTSIGVPPSGAGECCAPKLLQGAYLRRLRPIAIAEYWYGRPKKGEIRMHGEHYPACRGKCLPVLRWMLQGLDLDKPIDSDPLREVDAEPEIIYENRWFCIINKPAGMLSVPGKGALMSLQQWLARKYGPEREVKLVHRLDQDTSGLIVAAFGETPFKEMQKLFATRNVRKRYIADLEGDYESLGLPPRGRISLPLAPDWLDRPRQRVDYEGGKEAITDYEFISRADSRSRIAFHPLTGRTHQLRVHSASGDGLGIPIVGDRLYGKKLSAEAERMHLHAQKIEFLFPIDGKHYSFESPVLF